MKKKSILSLLAAALAFTGMGSLASCEDMMKPEIDRYVTQFDGKDTVYFYLGIMRNMQDLVENNVLAGELRSDLVTTTPYTSDSVANIMNFNDLSDGTSGLLNRAAYYKVINQCNYYLNKVDTMSSKNGYFYMRRETAQVLAARAWTYLQLVQAYGEAPFITIPVENANTGWETSAPKINADNMVDLLKADLMRSMDYEKEFNKINYGNYNTGAVRVNSILLNFPPSVILADMYLTRGASQSDYETAAQLYYDYLRTERGTVKKSPATWTKFSGSSLTLYYSSYSSWNSGVGQVSYSATNDEVRTLMPSAANAAFGKVMTKVPEIFGFRAISANSTNTSTDANGKNNSTTQGAVDILADFRLRQVAPSSSYIRLNEVQSYTDYNPSVAASGYDLTYLEKGDARLEGSAPHVRTEEGEKRFIQKFGSANFSGSVNAFSPGAFSFRYGIPLYRIRKIYLNFAEAINRAGFPRHAFALLRDGLGGRNDFFSKSGTVNKIPDVSYNVTSDYNDADSTIKAHYFVTHVENGLDYLTADELRRAKGKEFLNFSSSTNFNNYGIHELGSGEKGDVDTVYTYAKVVSQRILDEAKRGATLTSEVEKLAHKILHETYVDTFTVDNTIDRSDYKVIHDTTDAALPAAEEINAVETLILDEMALEAAFEGYRMADLIRVARHKTAAGTDGTTWLAWKIARRNSMLAPYEDPMKYDESLYSKLLNPKNWYLRAPEY